MAGSASLVRSGKYTRTQDFIAKSKPTNFWHTGGTRFRCVGSFLSRT